MAGTGRKVRTQGWRDVKDPVEGDEARLHLGRSTVPTCGAGTSSPQLRHRTQVQMASLRVGGAGSLWE